MDKAEITPKEAAQAVGMRERTLYYWLKSGVIPEEDAFQSISGRWTITVSGLQRLVEQRIKPRDGGRTKTRLAAWIEQERGRFVA